MTLVDRYVAAVGRRLPRKQRRDVEAELRSSLYDALGENGGDDGEGAPSEEKVVALLQRMGPPEKVAASYRPQDQFLIGPELFPTFRMVVKVVLAAYAGALVLAFALAMIFGEGATTGLAERLGSLLSAIVEGSIGAVGVVVLVFYALQRLGVQPEEREEAWDPRTLPAVLETDVVSRGEAALGVVIPAIFLVFLNGFQDRLGFLDSAVQDVLLTEVLFPVLPWLNAALLLGMGLHALLLWQGRWQGWTRVANFGADVFGIWVLFEAATRLAAAQEALLAAGLPEPLPVMLSRIGYSIVVGAAVVVLWETAVVVYRSLQGRKGKEPWPAPAR